MNLGIHQPECFPWIGFFRKIYKSDEFVFLDDCQFEKNYVQNRNLFQNRKQEYLWITLPTSERNSKTLLNEIYVKDFAKLRKIHKFFEIEYPDSIIRKSTLNLIEQYIDKQVFQLIKFNLDVINLILNYLELPNKKMNLSSELEINSLNSDRILDICRKKGTKKYLSGKSGKNYLEENRFRNLGIDIEYLDDSLRNPIFNSTNKFQLSTLHYLFKGLQKQVIDEIKN